VKPSPQGWLPGKRQVEEPTTTKKCKRLTYLLWEPLGFNKK